MYHSQAGLAISIVAHTARPYLFHKCIKCHPGVIRDRPRNAETVAKGLGKTATGGHSPLRVRVPSLAVSHRNPKPQNTEGEQTTSGCFGSLSLAVCTRKILGSSLWTFARGEGRGSASGRKLTHCRRQDRNQVCQRKGQECRSRFLATRCSGAEPKARRAGLPKCCTCAAASRSTPSASSRSGDTPGGAPRQDTAKEGTYTSKNWQGTHVGRFQPATPACEPIAKVKACAAKRLR